MVQLNNEQKEEKLSEVDVPQFSSSRHNEESEELEEDSEEEPSEELEEDAEEEISEELEEDPEEEQSEEGEEDAEEEPIEEGEEDADEDPSEEGGEDKDLQVGPEELCEEPEENVEDEDPHKEPENNSEEDEPSEELEEEEACMEQCQSLSDCNDSITEDPLEECSPKQRCQRNTDKSEYLSGPISNGSNEKKRTLHATADESTPLRDYPSQKKYRLGESTELIAEIESGTSELHGKSGLPLEQKGECTSEQQEKSGSSGKRRRSRWDQQSKRDGETEEDNRAGKRRKSRWANDDSQSKMLGPLQLPDFRKEYVVGSELDSEFEKLKAKILEINNELLKPELQDDRPVYNELGVRINTQEAKLRKKLVEERQHIISMLIKKNSTFQPPDAKPRKFCKKLYIPVNEYPGYNFVGLIMGPRGNTHKMMEKETGAIILLRGKESTLRPEKSASENEDLHVRIEADNQKSLDAAVAMVEKLLIPIDEEKNVHKRAQLVELAKLNGTLRKGNVCNVCGELGHLHYACPDRQSTFKTTVSCNTCGSNSHVTATCPLTASSPNACLGTSNPKVKPSKEIDNANLYVGYLSSVVDDHRLKELFCPYGKLIEATVIMDRTTGTSKGYGFVKFESASDAAVAITHLNGYKMDGKMLAVRVAGRPQIASSPVVSRLPQYPGPPAATPVASCLPQYPGPPTTTPVVASQLTWPGPPGSLLPEQASFPGTSSVTMLSSSIYVGPGDLLPKPKAFDSAIPSNVSSHSAFNSGRSLLSYSNQMVTSSPSSTPMFPGDPDYCGSKYQSYFMTSTVKPSPSNVGQTPGSESKSISWPAPLYQGGTQ